MVTGDNLATACAIATECGIYHPESGGVAVEGSFFRRLSPANVRLRTPDGRAVRQ